MKLLLKITLMCLLLFLSFSVKAEESNQDPSTITIHYFYSSNCTVCRSVTAFLDVYLDEVADVNLVMYNVLEGGDNEAWFIEATNTFNRENLAYPYIIIGGVDLQGKVEIEAHIDEVLNYYRQKEDYTDVVRKIQNDELVLPSDFATDLTLGRMIRLPIIGHIDMGDFSLLLAAVLIGLIDGFNPCAMWILVFLITMLINLKDRRKMWILGLVFILMSGLIYYLIMTAWLRVVIKVAMIQAFQIAIGILALVFSLVSLKHFWKQHRADTGCEVTSVESKRKLMMRMRKIISLDNIWLAAIGIAGVAVTVNIIELACSAGLPVIYTTMLGYHGLTNFQSAIYILIYVIFFVFDDLLVFTIAVITFKITGISNKFSKYSNLFGGLIMLALGVILIFFPEILL